MKLKSKKLKNGLLLAAVVTIISAPLYSYAIDYTATGDSSGSSIDYTAGGGKTSDNKTYSSGGGLEKVIKLPEDSPSTQKTTSNSTQPDEGTATSALQSPSKNEIEEDEAEICTDEDRATLKETDEKILVHSKNAEAAYNVALNLYKQEKTSLDASDIADFRSDVENNNALFMGEDFGDNIALYKKCNQSPPLTAFAPAPIQIINILGLDSL